MYALMTRRNVLLGGALVAAGGTVGGLAWLPKTAPGYRVLSSHEADIIEMLARVQFPPGYFSVAGGDGGTAPMVDEVVDQMLVPEAAIGFRYLLRSLDLSALVARGVRYSQLPVDEAHEFLDIWFSESPSLRRIASEPFKVLVGMGFLRRPEVIRDIGWRRGCSDEGPA